MFSKRRETPPGPLDRREPQVEVPERSGLTLDGVVIQPPTESVRPADVVVEGVASAQADNPAEEPLELTPDMMIGETESDDGLEFEDPYELESGDGGYTRTAIMAPSGKVLSPGGQPVHPDVKAQLREAQADTIEEQDGDELAFKDPDKDYFGLDGLGVFEEPKITEAEQIRRRALAPPSDSNQPTTEAEKQPEAAASQPDMDEMVQRFIIVNCGMLRLFPYNIKVLFKDIFVKSE